MESQEQSNSPLLLWILGIARDLLKVFARQLVVGIDPQGALKMKLGFRKLAYFRQSTPQIGFRVCIIRAQADGGTIVLNCVQEFVLRGKSIRQIVLCVKVVWLCFEGSG